MNFNTLIYSTLFLFIAFTNNLPITATDSQPLMDVNEKARITQNSVYDAYYNYLQNNKGFLEDESYINNLVIFCELDGNFPKNGEVLLKLIKKLEETNNEQSNFLLDNISLLFSLRFHEFICHIDLPKQQQAGLFRSYYHLNNFSIETAEGKFHPFRILLTKTIISFFMIHYSAARFNQKMSSWVHTLELFRKKMHALNITLADQKVSTEMIDIFSDNIEVYALTEPLVKPRNIQRIILISSLLIALTAGAIYAGIKFFPKSYDDFKCMLNETGEALGTGLGKGIKTTVVDPTVQGIVDRSQEIGQNMAEGMSTVPVGYRPNPNREPSPHLVTLGEQIMLGAATQPINHQQPPGREPNQNIEILGNSLGENAGQGILTAIRNLDNLLSRAITLQGAASEQALAAFTAIAIAGAVNSAFETTQNRNADIQTGITNSITTAVNSALARVQALNNPTSRAITGDDATSREALQTISTTLGNGIAGGIGSAASNAVNPRSYLPTWLGGNNNQ